MGPVRAGEAPFGPPGEAAFQARVLIAALELLEAAAGPVLADFPEEAPDSGSPTHPLACPVHFPLPPVDGAGELLRVFTDEVSQMGSWYHLGRSRRGRSTMGLCDLDPEAVALFLAAFPQDEARESPVPGCSLAAAVRMAAEDLKGYYFEAIASQPGQPSGSAPLADWFWGETAAARVINAIRERCLAMAGEDYQLLGKLLLVPRTQLHRFQK